jgi:hypothetical protein
MQGGLELGKFEWSNEEARSWYVRALQVQNFPEGPLVSPSDPMEAQEEWKWGPEVHGELGGAGGWCDSSLGEGEEALKGEGSLGRGEGSLILS